MTSRFFVHSGLTLEVVEKRKGDVLVGKDNIAIHKSKGATVFTASAPTYPRR
jgi:hypothetical protein